MISELFQWIVSQTRDITDFADIFQYDVTIKALGTLWSTISYLWRNNY